MNDSPLNDSGQEALTFSAFGSPNFDMGDGDSSRPKLKFPCRMRESLRKLLPVPQHRIVSRHHLDAYGRPRILTGWEAVAHILAWPTVIGVVLGFGLAIALVAFHNFSAIKII